jgi:glycosyltransferase involved in cell wall biosynthesis
MKILLITDNHDPAGGGAEKYFFTLKAALQQVPGVTVHSLGFGKTAASGEDFTVLAETPSKLAQLFWRLFFNRKKYAELRKVILALQPDVIHLHNIRKYTPALLKAVSGFPVVQTVHDYTVVCPTGWNVHRHLTPCPTGLRGSCVWQHRRGMNPVLYLGLLLAFARTTKKLKQTVSRFIAPSPQLTDYLQRNGFQHAQYVSPFLQTETSTDMTAMQGQHFLYVGQLGKHKGVDKLLDEFHLAYQRNPALTLTIAGRGPEEQALRQQVAVLKLEQAVNFTGWTDPNTLYAQCVALVFPSIGMEAFGLVMTEAMQHSRAVIGVNRGTTAWLVEDGKTGLLYDPLLRGDLADKMLLLASDRARAEQYGKAGYEKMRGFMSQQQIADEMMRIYGAVLEGASRR